MDDIRYEPVDLRSADEATSRALWQFNNLMRAERLPDDPQTPFESFMGSNRNIPEFYVVHGLVARDRAGTIVGSAFVDYEPAGENSHLADLDLEVHPDFRRRGIGRRLLHFAAEEARTWGCRRMLGFTSDLVAAGGAFAHALGAEPGLVERHSQLVLAELDRAMLATWQARAAERAADYELVFLDSGYPDELLTPLAELMNVMNTAPRGALELEDHLVTPEKLVVWHQSTQASGYQEWMLVARNRSSGELAGFTELYLNPLEPTIVRQGATGVQPAHRNLGLGRWLKAAMLERLLAERPDARFVRTDNAETNEPMLAINVALGFRHYMDVTIWQVDVERALAFAADQQGVGQRPATSAELQ